MSTGAAGDLHYRQYGTGARYRYRYAIRSASAQRQSAHHRESHCLTGIAVTCGFPAKFLFFEMAERRDKDLKTDQIPPDVLGNVL